MFDSLKGCATKLVMALAVVLIAYGGWRWGSAVFPRAEAILGIERPEETAEPPTAEIAEAARTRLEGFADSGEPELRLESVELSSLLRYSVPGVLPGGVVEPQVFMSDDRIEIHAGVVPGRIPELPDLGPIVGILPDTVGVEVGGSLIPFGDEGSMLMVTRMQARGVPIPRRLFPEILRALGRDRVPGLPPEAVLIPVPRGIRGAYIEDGQLVLLRP